MLKASIRKLLQTKELPRCIAAYSDLKVVYNDNSLIGKWDMFKYKVGWEKLRFPLVNIRLSAENLYSIAAEYPDFTVYVRKFGLPNTYQVWFLMMGLHTWLILLRLRSEGVEGVVAKGDLFTTLYNDVRSRMKGFNVSNKNKVFSYLETQLVGLMLGLDEGLLSGSDCTLANSLWRDVFFMFHNESDDDYRRLEALVEYLFKQIDHLHSLPAEDFLCYGRATFLPFDGNRLDKAYAKERLRYCMTRPDIVDYD